MIGKKYNAKGKRLGHKNKRRSEYIYAIASLRGLCITTAYSVHFLHLLSKKLVRQRTSNILLQNSEFVNYEILPHFLLTEDFFYDIILN